MGHTVREGVDEHYRPTDVEFHRKLYAEKAMPFLRLETATPTETEKTIEELRAQLKERDKEIAALKGTVTKLQPLVEFVNSFNHPKELKKILDFLKDDSMIQSSYDPKIQLDKYIAEKLDEIVNREGVTQKEALERLVTEGWKTFEKADETRKKQAKAHGLSITKEDYEKQKKTRTRR
ncbi:MAG: hypothetical protein OEZ24_03870 [Candidatus Bathyarchaeota archaeon]|nr:hypothetical protein [Candidatus Bathyarchaeota archaeon]